jgi:hypothetical protein
MLAFDPVGHEYRWKGATVPGVTSIIGAALGNPFAHIPPAVLEHKRRIGEATHLACHLDDLDDLDEGSVHPEVRPRLDAWRAFRYESGCDVLVSERRLYHPAHGFAGTPDRYVLINGARAVVDIKTGLPGPQAALQTAAYAQLIDAEFGAEDTPLRRFALRALPTGRYKFDEYTSLGDWRDFLACLTVYRLKERIENE